MKLKFRAEKKDAIIFLIFSLVLLYLIAIAISNIGTFLSENQLSGLNPLPAFTDYLLLTIVLFAIVIAVLVMSVQSHFFEMEKGVGITVAPKKEKNYSRWAKDKEIQNDDDVELVDPTLPKSDAAGIPLIMNPKQVWVDNGGYHNLVIGSTGAGKTQTTVLPMVNLLAKNDESMIITDPKGEIYENTSNYLKSLGYNIVLLNFRDPQQGNSWNPMYLPYSLYKDNKIDKSVELLEDLASNILRDPSAKGQDPFWENTSADYFAGLAFGLFEDAKEEEINLNSINLMTTVGEEKLANTTYMKEYFSYKDPTSTGYVKASSTLMAPSETKGSILSVFKQKVQLFATRKNLSEMLANNDFDMRDIGKKKTAVFIVIQDEKTTYHSLVTIFLKQCYETLISVAQEMGGKLPHRTNFILDEFANMPPLKDVTTMVTAARSRNMRFTFIIQNFAQLYEVYGKENGETIKGNCGNIVYLISTELSALEEISKMCGEVKSKEKEKTSSTPLVTVSDLQRMKKWETIVLRIRMMPFKTKLTPNFQMNWGHDFPKAKYPNREEKEVKVFDLKAFVNKKRDEKMQSMMAGMGNPTGGAIPPFGPGGMGGFNPGLSSGMFGANPGMGGVPIGSIGGNSPIGGMHHGNPIPPGMGSNFDVNELIKNIDAKIAEIEEEERREKEKAEKEAKERENKKDQLEQDIISAEVEPVDNSKPLFDDEQPMNKPKEESKTTPKFDISDDQFFDDFFGDD